MSADRIRITGIAVHARHGVLEREKSRDQLFLIDLELGLDLSTAGNSDDLSDTVDYGTLAVRAAEFASTRTFDLIERLAEGLAELVLENPSVETVSVTVHKPEAPIDLPFSDVAVTIERSR